MNNYDYTSALSTERVFALLSDFSEGFNPDQELSDLPANKAKLCVNFKAEVNSLTPAFGLSKDTISIPLGTRRLWYFEPQKTHFAATEDGKLYSCSYPATTFTAVTDVEFTSLPNMFTIYSEGKLYAVFSAQNNPLILWSSPSETYSVLADADIFQAALFDGRVYAIAYDSSILYSVESGEITQWNFTQKSTLELSRIGKLLKLVQAGSSLAVFGSRGIARIGTYSDAKSADVVYLSTGEILADTISAAGSGIYFATESALFYYNGLDSVKKIRSLKLSLSAFAFTDCFGYRLISDNTAYLLEPASSCFSMCDLLGKAVCGCALPSPRVYIPTLAAQAMLLSQSGQLEGIAATGRWRSPLLLVGKGVKRLHSVYLRCNCPVTVTLQSGSYKKSVYAKPCEGEAKACFDVVGKSFTIELSARLTPDLAIRSAYLEYSLSGGSL